VVAWALKQDQRHNVKNFYTASEAQTRLGVTKSSFFYLVRTGKIEKVVFPGKKQGVYPRSEIDQLAASIKALIDQYEPSCRFETATLEDLQTEVDIDLLLYGEKGTTPLEKRIERLTKNPESNFVLRRGAEIVGHMAFYPMEQTYLQKLLRAQVSGIPVDMVLPWLVGTPLNIFISIISVKPGFPQDLSKHFGLRLLAGAVGFFRVLGERGVILETISCTTRTPKGIKLAADLGMTGELIGDEPDRWRFSLNVAASDSLLVGEYKQGLEAYHRLHS
jgi:hypothetical protein